jgi:proline dehydrogenase
VADQAPPAAELEPEVQRVGRSLAAAFPSGARHPIRNLDAKAMELATQDDQLRAALLRLVDVTPATRSLDDLAGHLRGYLSEVDDRPLPVDTAMRMAGSGPGRRALGVTVAAGVRHMAHRFIVGETPAAALGTIRSQWKSGIATSLDLLGEATVTQEEADRYAARCREAIETVSADASDWPSRPALERDSVGPVPRVNVSVKVSALTPLMRPEAPAVAREDAARRLRPLLRLARDQDAHLHVDMESLDTLEATTELFFELLDEEDFRQGPSAGLVLQAYLRESPAQLDRMIDWARATARTPPLVIRLVKGAYWDQEIVEARQHGWTPPVFEEKADCDRNFERLAARLVEAHPVVRAAIGSHNLRSVASAIASSRAAGGEDRDLEIQVLRGLGDELAEALATHGFRVRSYCPVGDLVAGMAYLVRRLLENTSNESFLQSWREGAELDELLAAP